MVHNQQRKKTLIEHVMKETAYSSDSEVPSKKKRPLKIKRIEYSLSSEEGPLNISA